MSKSAHIPVEYYPVYKGYESTDIYIKKIISSLFISSLYL